MEKLNFIMLFITIDTTFNFKVSMAFHYLGLLDEASPEGFQRHTTSAKMWPQLLFLGFLQNYVVAIYHHN
jgi:hypothetical protein